VDAVPFLKVHIMSMTRRSVLTRALTGAVVLPLLSIPARAATTHQVAIQGMAFVPADLTIAAGDSVTWTNADNGAHTATAESGAFDTGRLVGGATATLTFNGAGSFAYICAIHTSMKGTITVA
jgi:plastocyanin